MLSRTDSALDLGAAQLVLHSLSVGVLLFLLCILLPVGRGAEDDVLADGGGVGSGSGRVVGGQAELGPLLAGGDAGIDDGADDGGSDALGHLDGLALVVVLVEDACLCAVAVLDDFLGGQRGGGGFYVVVVVVGPVAGGGVVRRHTCSAFLFDGCRLSGGVMETGVEGVMCFDENGKIESGVELCDGFKAERAFQKVATRILETHTGKLSMA